MDDNIGVALDRSSHLVGTVRVPFSALSFNSEPRQISRSNVRRLVSVFETEGCLRHDRENVLPAIIDDSALAAALQASSTSAEALRLQHDTVPPQQLTIPPPHRILCLHGQHRILAAKEYLGNENDWWWNVELYRDGRSDTPPDIQIVDLSRTLLDY